MEDGEHHDLLWQALRQSGSRLVIASPRLNRHMVTTATIRQLERRLNDGLPVTLTYSPDRHGKPEEAVEELRRTHRGRLVIVPGPTNARCLISDDEVCVGSFACLSGAPHRAPRRRPNRSGSG